MFNIIQHISDPLLNSHYSVCPKPCKTLRSTVSKRLSSGFKEKSLKLRQILLNFGPIVRVKKEIPKMTMLNVINDIGSSMGLWLGFSTYSGFKMLQYASYAWSNKKVMATHNDHHDNSYDQHHAHPYDQHHGNLNFAACILCLGHREDRWFSSKPSQPHICHSRHLWRICTWGSFHLYVFGCLTELKEIVLF